LGVKALTQTGKPSDFDNVLSNRWTMVKRAIEEWQPGQLTTHQDFKISLFEHLRNCFGTGDDSDIECEFPHGRSRCDIRVSLKKWLNLRTRRFSIEISHKLQQMDDLKYVMGQVQILNGDDMFPLFIVVCGRSSPSLIDSLRLYARGFGEGFGCGDVVEVIVK
jgi:hypothetical protein